MYIDIEGKEEDIGILLNNIKTKPPQLSKINEIQIEDKKVVNYEKFNILKSNAEVNAITLISPDTGVCEDCIKDITDMKNRRYKYPFTNCTNCGPRFSIIKDLPYDREATCMNQFIMCNECRKEYENPLDRRFHAQPTACPICGPQIELVDNEGNKIKSLGIAKKVPNLIGQGFILAIKGLGGFHLACNAKCEDVIQKLRIRKKRPTKPLALMMKDIETVKKFCHVSHIEEKILCSERKPIILLNKKNDLLPYNIAPHNKRLGIMLPYTPLHHLLFDEGIDVLVMTSANKNSMPIIYKNDDAIHNLKDIADHILIHNRDIHIPIDDSVSMVVLHEERVLRNSRGYAPINVKHSMTHDILASGSHLKNTFAISKKDNVFISQYIGDVENTETCDRVNMLVKHFKNVYNINPELIVHDMHPNYWSKEYVKTHDSNNIEVQHHHAHIVSCMVENEVKDRVIGIAYDGSGYGADKKMWGGEFLICDYASFKRVGHLNYVCIPGGESAIKEPWRMAISYLHKVFGNNLDENLPNLFKGKDVKNVKTIINSNINIIDTSSVGRLFDTAAAILGFMEEVTYEGEAAIFLEHICDENEKESYTYDVEYVDDVYIINTNNILKGLLSDLGDKISRSLISRRFHNTVINFSVHLCELISGKYDINKVALSGGVFQNQIILREIYKKLMLKGFEVYTHKLIPCNDSGICLGQIVIANERCKE